MTATPAWPPKSAPRLFITPEITAGSTHVVDGEQGHYLSRVMRVARDDTIILLDNITGEWAGRVHQVDKRSATIVIDRQLRSREVGPDIWLVVAPVKQRFDMVIEKATELGAAKIIPVQTRRSVVTRINAEKTEAHIREAAEQCARTALPAVGAMRRLPQLLAEWPKNRTLFFADETGGHPARQAMRDHPGPAAILIGPEGGFDPEEREGVIALPQAVGISLGPRILRAETAAIAALGVWMAQCGDWSPD